MIRTIIAGLGRRGRDWAREVAADPSFELVAAVDVDPSALPGQGLGPDRRFTTLDDALAKVAADVVIVATPADRHEEVCNTAIERGLALLIEKPMTMSVRTATHIVRSAAAKGLPVVVGQNHRYLRSWRTVRRVIDGGLLGPVRMVHCHYYRGAHEMAPSLMALDHSVLWGIAVHHIDALRFVLGQRITAVLNEAFAPPWKPTRGSSMQTLLVFEDGTRVAYTASYDSNGHEYFEGGQELYARFVGDRATLHMIHRWLFLCERGRLPRPVFRGAREVSEERLLLRQLENAMRNGVTPECSGEDNLQTMVAIEACVRSAEERRWIDPRELLA
jgi:predicted dehydrogenase